MHFNFDYLGGGRLIEHGRIIGTIRYEENMYFIFT